jgi:hypothetical protein
MVIGPSVSSTCCQCNPVCPSDLLYGRIDFVFVRHIRGRDERLHAKLRALRRHALQFRLRTGKYRNISPRLRKGQCNRLSNSPPRTFCHWKEKNEVPVINATSPLKEKFSGEIAG